MMTQERAEEIRQLGSMYCNWSKYCTRDEYNYVTSIWNTMPGYTCWYDALLRICKGEVKPSDFQRIGKRAETKRS